MEFQQSLTRRRFLALSAAVVASVACTENKATRLGGAREDIEKQMDIIRAKRPDCFTPDVDKELERISQTPSVLAGKQRSIGPAKNMKEIEERRLAELVSDLKQTPRSRGEKNVILRSEYIELAQEIENVRNRTKLDEKTQNELADQQQCLAFKAASLSGQAALDGLDKPKQ